MKMTQIPKNKPWQSVEYRKFVKEFPCIWCLHPNPDVAHHEDKGFHNSGMAIKPPDSQCVSGCASCHADHHQSPDLNALAKMKDRMIETLSAYINEKYNTNPKVLIVNLLTDWIKKQGEK